MNPKWHQQHVMPKNATEAQRIAWHREHQKHCACRPIPPKLQALMQAARTASRTDPKTAATLKAKPPPKKAAAKLVTKPTPKATKTTSETAEPTLEFASAEEWRAWLASHHAKSSGVLLRLEKGATKAMSYAEALEVALCWGWIDSRKSPLDASAWLQRFTPRTAKSPWSKINRTKAEALLTAGKLQPPGLAQVERAKADGRWERAYDGAKTSDVPEDLASALSRNARAKAFFEKLDGANRYAILYRVHTAKKPETRAERIARFVTMCGKGETIHPARPRKAPKPKND